VYSSLTLRANDPGQHKFGLEHRVELIHESVQRRCQISMDWVLDPALDVGYGSPSVAFVPASVQRLGGDAVLDNEVAAEILGSASPRFSCHSRISAASSALIVIRAPEPSRNLPQAL
jgi:hypothetical protein